MLLASMALASDPEDPEMFYRKLRKETRDTSKDTHGLGRGGKRILETKETQDANKNTSGLGHGEKRTLEIKQRPQTLGRGGKRSLAVNPRSLKGSSKQGDPNPVPNPDPNSCDGHCNTQAPGGCWCDEFCVGNGDCCSDACDECTLSTCPPANDLCENASLLNSFQTGFTVSATLDNVGTCGTPNTAAGVWYSVSGISGQITVDTCSPFSNFDTKISVFQGSCGILTCVDGNDDENSGCSLNGLLVV